jgi:hypothetical protein
MAKINFKDLDFSKIILEEPQEKPTKGGGVSYPIEFKYNFGTDEAPNLKRFYLEAPLMRSSGITENINNDGSLSYSMRSVVVNQDDSARFEEILDHLFDRCIKTVLYHAYNGAIPSLDFDKADGDAMNTKMFKKGLGGINSKTGKLYYYPVDEMGMRKPDSCASIYIKLDTGERSNGAYKSHFFNLAKKPVDWNMLYDVEVEFVPVLNINRIFIGKQNSIQFRTLRSAYITDLRERSQSNLQSDSIDAYLEANPDQLDILEEKIRLMKEKRGAGFPAPPAGEENDGLGGSSSALDSPTRGGDGLGGDSETSKATLESFMGGDSGALSPPRGGLGKPPSVASLKGF